MAGYKPLVSVPRLSPWLSENLICPIDKSRIVEISNQRLECGNAHTFPVIEGTPVLFHPGVAATLSLMDVSSQLAESASNGSCSDPFFVESVGVNEEEKGLIRRLIEQGGEIDPVVSVVIGATNGIMYRHLIGKLNSYPLPALRLPFASNGEMLLDIGCNWGRWTFSACKIGYRTIGIDPSLGSVMAAKRVAKKLNLKCEFVVGDARCLPFADGTFDRVFSYSVLQHFSKVDAESALSEVGRVLKPRGRSFIQMPNVYGVRCLYHQVRRRFRRPIGFEVRYWTPRQLLSIFAKRIGDSRLSADCFLGIGVQDSDFEMMPLRLRLVSLLSRALTKLSSFFPFLTWLADSIYVDSVSARSK